MKKSYWVWIFVGLALLFAWWTGLFSKAPVSPGTVGPQTGIMSS